MLSAIYQFSNWPENTFFFLFFLCFFFQVPMSPWSNYTFRVIARNKIGPSLPSLHSDVCTTPPDVPYRNPDGVEGRGTAPDNLEIRWTVSNCSRAYRMSDDCHAFIINLRTNI